MSRCDCESSYGDTCEVCRKALQDNQDREARLRRLNAAAPDLLAAAKAMFEPGSHGFDMLRAAIEKAEGNAPRQSIDGRPDAVTLARMDQMEMDAKLAESYGALDIAIVIREGK